MNKLMTKAFVLVSAAVTAIGALAYNGGYENSIDWRTNPAEGYGDYELTSTGPLSGAVGANAFAQCKALTSVDLSNVTSIGDAAFAYSALESVTIPASVTSMGYIAFGGCENLTSVTINSWDWYEADKEPFSGCDALSTLVVDVAPPSWPIKGAFPNITKIVCSSSCISAWRAAYSDVAIVGTPYNIYYELEGGAMATSPTFVGEGDNWYALHNPVRSGYRFAGWKIIDGLGSSAMYSTDNMTAQAWQSQDLVVVPVLGYITFSGLTTGSYVTLQAQWVANEYNIYYELDGGHVVSEPTFVAAGNTWYELKNPVRDGCRFAGWKVIDGLGMDAEYSIDGGSTSKGISSSSVIAVPEGGRLWFRNLSDGDYATIQAVWVEGEYNVYYELDGGYMVVQPPLKADGDAWYGIVNPVKSGYRFSGWKIIDGRGASARYSLDNQEILYWPSNGETVKPRNGSVAFSGLAAGSYVTLQAQWISGDYNIYYETAGGYFTTTPPLVGNCDNWYGIVNPVRDGYRFAGWKAIDGLGAAAKYSVDNVTAQGWVGGDFVVSAPNGYVTFTELADGDYVTLEAQWEAKVPYNLYYELRGGYMTSEPTFVGQPGQWYGLINPVRDGYVFDGWKIIDGLGQSAMYSTDNKTALAWTHMGMTVRPTEGYITFSTLTDGTYVTLEAQWKPISLSQVSVAPSTVSSCPEDACCHYVGVLADCSGVFDLTCDAAGRAVLVIQADEYYVADGYISQWVCDGVLFVGEDGEVFVMEDDGYGGILFQW